MNADHQPTASSSSLESRIDTLERQMQTERRRYRDIYESESAERRQQFAMVLTELCKAVEKMERNDIEIETSLRSELTRQNRFIYEEFRDSVSNLDSSLRSESARLEKCMNDRPELAQTIRQLLADDQLRF